MAPKTQRHATTTDLLKPCPFCGQKVIWYHEGTVEYHRYKVIIECLSCNLTMQSEPPLPLKEAEEKIMTTWNNRKE